MNDQKKRVKQVRKDGVAQHYHTGRSATSDADARFAALTAPAPTATPAVKLNGFDADGIHSATGTRYDLWGFNRDGVKHSDDPAYVPAKHSPRGFFLDTWQRPVIVRHFLTGTEYDLEGFDVQHLDAAGRHRSGADSNGRMSDGSIVELRDEATTTHFAANSTDPDVLRAAYADIVERRAAGSGVTGAYLLNNESTPEDVLVAITQHDELSFPEALSHPQMTDEGREHVFAFAQQSDWKVPSGMFGDSFNDRPAAIRNLSYLRRTRSTSRSLKLRVNKHMREMGFVLK